MQSSACILLHCLSHHPWPRQGPPGSWNLPTRPRRDGRRGAVSVVHIPLYLGRHVPLPLTRAHSPFRHVWLCAAVLRARALSLRASRCVGLARAPGQLESSRSASTRRAARSGECRAYPVVFGLPCPFAFNARAFGCARLCCARAHYRCAQVGVPGPAPAPARGPVPAPAPGPRPGPATLTGRCRAG
jgi:hypothetical protein